MFTFSINADRIKISINVLFKLEEKMMNKVSKILVAMAGTVLAAVVAVAPVKAGTLAEDQAWVQAQAEAGMKMAIAHQNDIAAQAAAGMASGQAYLDAALATMNKDQAYVAAQAAAGMLKGQAYLDQRAAEGKKGMIAGATEAVRVAKANLASVKDLAKANPQFADKIPAAEAALAQAEAALALLQ